MKNVLFGAVCLDIYTNTADVRPGCGILHNAYHLQQLGADPLLITRIGHAQAERFFNFFRANHLSIVSGGLVADGAPATIEVKLHESGEAEMSNFEPGVWHTFRLTPAEERLLAQATNVHIVLLSEIIPEFIRIVNQDILKGALISADLLDFGPFSVDYLSDLLNYLDIVFIGWKGELSHSTITAIKQVTMARRALVIITLGSRGIQVFDSLTAAEFQARFFEVEKVPVQHNTNGCGDAFIAYFLADYWRNCNLEQAIEQGKIGGARATRWRYALPDSAYET